MRGFVCASRAALDLHTPHPFYRGLPMPIYAYRCGACGHAQDVLQKMSDPLLTTCPACGAEAYTKQLTAAGFQLKGSGWYVTDFREGAKGAKAGKDEAGDKSAAEGGADKADDKAADKTADKAGEKYADKSADKPADKSADKSSDKSPSASTDKSASASAPASKSATPAAPASPASGPKPATPAAGG